MSEKEEIRKTLYNIEQHRKKMLQPKFLELGLTLGQGQPRILNALLTCENISQKELSVLCRLDVTTLSRTLDHMEKAGLIKRNLAADCRRSHSLVLTDKGRETAVKVRAIFNETDEIMCGGFKQSELEMLYKYLKQVERNLSEK